MNEPLNETLTKEERGNLTFDEVRYAVHNRLDDVCEDYRTFIDDSFNNLITLVRQYDATVQDLEQQLAEKDAALGALVEALNTFGQHSRFCELELLGRGFGTCHCGLIAALSPALVQQAAARYQQALAIIERVKNADFLGNAILRWIGFPDERPFARVAAVEQVQKALLGKALLGEEKP